MSIWADIWGDIWGPIWEAGPAPVVTTVQSGGGGTLHLPTGRRRSKEELQAERERLGILPKPETVVLKAKPRRLPAQVIEAELDRAVYERIRQTQEDELVLVLLMH